MKKETQRKLIRALKPLIQKVVKEEISKMFNDAEFLQETMVRMMVKGGGMNLLMPQMQMMNNGQQNYQSQRSMMQEKAGITPRQNYQQPRKKSFQEFVEGSPEEQQQDFQERMERFAERKQYLKEASGMPGVFDNIVDTSNPSIGYYDPFANIAQLDQEQMKQQQQQSMQTRMPQKQGNTNVSSVINELKGVGGRGMQQTMNNQQRLAQTAKGVSGDVAAKAIGSPMAAAGIDKNHVGIDIKTIRALAKPKR